MACCCLGVYDSYSDCVLLFSERSIGEKESGMGDWSADPSSRIESSLLCSIVEVVVEAKFWIPVLQLERLRAYIRSNSFTQ